jgi:hypothetical protein
MPSVMDGTELSADELCDSLALHYCNMHLVNLKVNVDSSLVDKNIVYIKVVLD